MLLQKHKRKAAVSRKVVEWILPPTYKVSRLRESSSDRSVPQSRSEHLKRNGAPSAVTKARRRHEEFVARLSSPLGSSVNSEATYLIKYRVQVDLDGLLENSAY
jgi:hypothetical protein